MIAASQFTKLHAFFLCLIVAVSLPLLDGVKAWGSWDRHHGDLRFSNANGELLQRGKDQVEALHAKSEDEGFLDIMLGTNCYTSAVRSLERGCQAMDAGTSMWLAFHLANCLWAKTGRRTYSGQQCTQQGGDAASCISQMTSEDYIVFVQFLQNVHTMCMFVANTDFQERAGAMLNTLFRAGSEASLQVARLNEGMQQQASTLRTMDGELQSLARDQQHIFEGLKSSIEILVDLRSAAADLSEGMHRSEAAHEQLIRAEEAVANKVTQMREEQLHHAEASYIAWKAAEEQARRVLEWQVQYSRLQEKIFTTTEAMTKASDGVMLALSFVETAQQQSNSALATVLGKSYRLTDFAYYGSGVVMVMALGWHARLHHARLLVFVLFLACIGLERTMLGWLSPWTKLGPFEQPMLCLPPPLQWVIGPFSVEWIKYCIRGTVSIFIAVVLVRTQLANRSPDTALDRLLRYLKELESRQTGLWHDMESRILVALQHFRRSGSSSQDGNECIDITAQGHAREQEVLQRMSLQAIQGRMIAAPARLGHDGIANHQVQMHSSSANKQPIGASGGRHRARHARRLAQSGEHNTIAEPVAALPDQNKHATFPQPVASSLRRQRPQRLGSKNSQDMPGKVPELVLPSSIPVSRSLRISGSQQSLGCSASRSGLEEDISDRRLSRELGAAHASPQQNLQQDLVGNKRFASVSRQKIKKRKKIDN